MNEWAGKRPSNTCKLCMNSISIMPYSCMLWIINQWYRGLGHETTVYVVCLARSTLHCFSFFQFKCSSWWRHQMETFSALLAICAGNSPVPGEFPTQRPVTWSFDVFFDRRQNKRLNKQSSGWWFETLSRPLWRHSNDYPENDCHNVDIYKPI